MPQERSDFLCISYTVPVETDIPRAGEFGCKWYKGMHALTGWVSGAAFSQQWPHVSYYWKVKVIKAVELVVCTLAAEKTNSSVTVIICFSKYEEKFHSQKLWSWNLGNLVASKMLDPGHSLLTFSLLPPLKWQHFPKWLCFLSVWVLWFLDLLIYSLAYRK